LEAQKQQRLADVKTVAENAHGLLARLNALHQLARDRDNLALGWAILCIFFRLPRGGDGPGPHQGPVRIRPVRYAAGPDRNGSLTSGDPTAPQCAGAHPRSSPIPR
jgi:hypothetical protein